MQEKTGISDKGRAGMLVLQSLPCFRTPRSVVNSLTSTEIFIIVRFPYERTADFVEKEKKKEECNHIVSSAILSTLSPSPFNYAAPASRDWVRNCSRGKLSVYSLTTNESRLEIIVRTYKTLYTKVMKMCHFYQ